MTDKEERYLYCNNFKENTKSVHTVQAIAESVNGLYVILQPQLTPQTIDMHINSTTFTDIGIAPGFLHKLTTSECSAAMCKQYNKQGKFLLGQTEFMPRAAHVVRGKIDRKIFIKNGRVYGGTLLFIKLGSMQTGYFCEVDFTASSL